MSAKLKIVRLLPILFFIANFVLVPSVKAQVPKLREVPPVLQDSQSLLAKGKSLRRRLTHLQQLGREFMRDCYVERGSPEEKECEDEQIKLEVQKQDYVSKANRFNQLVDRAIGKEKRNLQQDIDRLAGKIKGHQQAIRNLGLPTSAQQFEEWHDLSSSAKKDFQRAALSAVFAEGFIAAQSTLKVAKSLNPPKANTLVRELKESGINSPQLFKLIREVALVKGKPEYAKSIKPLLKRSSELVDLAMLDKKPTREAKLRGLATLLRWFVENPVLNKLLVRYDFGTTVLYSFYAIHEVGPGVKQLSQITQQQLDGLEQIVGMMKKDMKALKTSKEKLRILSSLG